VEANFSDSMPELNFDNEQVRQAVLDIGAYYLDMGVDGFRFDAAKYPYLGDHEKNVELWTWYVGELKKINPQVYTVAEVWDSEGITNRYAAAVNCFNFSTSQAEGLIAETAKAGDVNKLTASTQKTLDTLREINPEAMNIPFIANHDTDRAAGYLTMAGGRMAVAASLYLLSPGSPFIYYGEEIGLRGSRGGANTDANRRLAMLWGDGDTVKDPQGSNYTKQTTYSAADLLKMKGSLLNHYKKLLMVRKANPEIARGEYTALTLKDTKAGGFLCTWNGSTAAVIHNTTEKTQTVNLKEATDLTFTQIAAVLEAVIGEGGAELEDGVLTLYSQTSVVLR
jgi:glycosidase